MADTKISDLAAVTDVLSTDEFVLARSGTTKKISGADLGTEIGGGASSGPYVHLRDEKTANTSGGSSVATTWTARVLNTEVTDTDAICSLSSNQIVLAAGTYHCHASAPFYVTGRCRLRLRNVTAGVTLLLSHSAKSHSTGDTADGLPQLFGRFIVAASQTLELQYWAEAVAAARGLGVEANAGEVEVYAQIQFWKIS